MEIEKLPCDINNPKDNYDGLKGYFHYGGNIYIVRLFGIYLFKIIFLGKRGYGNIHFPHENFTNSYKKKAYLKSFGLNGYRHFCKSLN